MSAAIDIHGRTKRVLLLVSNPATSSETGWPVGFWWAELTHPYWEFAQAGYEDTIESPDGGTLRADSWSDPADESGYSAHELISGGFASSSEHMALVRDTPSLSSLDLDSFDALFLVGGQAPMFTFRKDEPVKDLVGSFLADGKVGAVVCHATCLLLDATMPDGELVVAGRTWTGFANSEEQCADDYAGTRIQPFWIEDEASALEGTNFIVQGRFRPPSLCDGNLVTGQQQYSGAAAARLVIEALGR